MTRSLFVVLLVITLGGCQTPPERGGLQTLPDDNPPLAYPELLARARTQATVATEAFYVNRWNDLEESAKNLEQTARFFAKATDVPALQKDKLNAQASELEKEARRLREAAKAGDAKQVNDTMQRINLRIRSLHQEK